MKLLKLWINNYKNLTNLTIDFEKSNGLSIFVGNNGTGKSNIIECLSEIFNCLYNNKISKIEYELTYSLNDNIITIINKKRRLVKKNGKVISRYLLERDNLLPTNIITMYSGEDERLYRKYYYSNEKHKHDRLIYVDKRMWKNALFTLVYSQLENIKNFLKNEINIDTVNNIIFLYTVKNFKNNQNEVIKEIVTQNNPEEEYRWIRGKIQDINNFFNIKNQYNLKDNKLYLAGDVSKIILSNSLSYYENEIFNILKQSNITDILIYLNNSFEASYLSEGQKKMILFKVILEFLGDENSLILFDEPDAFINESRKEGLYNELKEYATNGRQIVLATHSPTFIDIAEQENIIMLKRNDNNNIEIFDDDRLSQIRYLTGSRINAFLEKTILYCEGTDRSLDKKLYSILFKNANIISSAGHNEVIENTRMYNKTFGTQNRAYGIIDFDFRTEENIKKLKEDKILVLNILEIENILLDEEIIKQAKIRFCATDEALEKTKSKIFERLKHQKEGQIVKYITSKFISELKEKIGVDRNIENFKNRIKELLNEEELDNLYNLRKKEIEEILDNNEYAKLHINIDTDHKIDYLLEEIIQEYSRRVLVMISEDANLIKYIKQKYLAELTQILEGE
ncbi:MAG: AAA family ATPase [Clostridia bacterium]|jgi:predicted ATPase|nr:AAA family ATPase [Clostridia bacterium]